MSANGNLLFFFLLCRADHRTITSASDLEPAAAWKSNRPSRPGVQDLWKMEMQKLQDVVIIRIDSTGLSLSVAAGVLSR